MEFKLNAARRAGPCASSDACCVGVMQVAPVVEKSAVENVVELVVEPSATTHEQQIYIELSQQAEEKPRPSLVESSEEAAAVESVEVGRQRFLV